MNAITAEEIQLFSKLIFDISGLFLGKDKGYLLETRLSPILSSYGYTSFAQLYARTKADSSGKLQHEIVEEMTTNETFFFRDNTPFDLMRNKIIPDLIDRRSRISKTNKVPIRIWSAACSTGQEVYSIAMILVEMLGDLSGYDIHILGTDISNKVIAKASYGKYNQFEMERGLPLHLRKRYFTQLGSDWRIKDELRSLAQFKAMNLMKPFADMGGKFDLIFCRNVAIYFNPADKIRLFQKISRVLQPDGALIIGGSETLSGIAPDFESRSYLKGIFYQLRGQPAPPAPQPATPPPPALGKDPPVMLQPKAPPPTSMNAFPTLEARGARSPEARSQAPTAASTPTATDSLAERVAPPKTTPPAPDSPSAQPAKPKKSLLAAIHSSAKEAKEGKEPPASLLSAKQSSPKSSLLDQLKKKKKRPDKEE